MTCGEPLEAGALVDYWLGRLPPDAGDRVEEHLFACASCSDRLEDLSSLAEGIRAIARDGAILGSLPWAVVERLAGDGVAVRVFRLSPGEHVPCAAAPDDALLVARLAADLAGCEHVDLTFELGLEPSQAGPLPVALRLEDVPVDRRRQEVVLAVRADLVHPLPAHAVRMKLLAPGPAGERLLGEYTLEHSPWPGAAR